MACTTILVGKKVSYNGSTIIARNDDSPTGIFHVKKMMVVSPKEQPKVYVSKISKLKIELPNNPLSYTSCPNVDLKEGVWAASGINSANVSMTATETITSNPRVMGADPLVNYIPAKNGQKAIPGGIGEEDLVAIILPYITSARMGVIRLGELLSKYGTYESNGIAFSDNNEIWWVETIGGHNWIARKVNDSEYVIMPNQFGLDRFDLNDAFGDMEANMCSQSLRELVIKNNLNLDFDGTFNPRTIFGSHSDSDHVYNTPRAWFMGRYFNPKTYRWDGPDADFSPESDDIPWSLTPERKITIEDVKYILSSHFQGTPFDPYSKDNNPLKGKYRPIGISRTAFMSINEIRNNVPKEMSAIEWICFASNMHNAIIPIYTNTSSIPSYLSNTTLNVESNNFYWASRIIASMADPFMGTAGIFIERYQDKVMNESHRILNKYDSLMLKEGNYLDNIKNANNEITKMAKKETDKVLNNVLYLSSCKMKNGFSRSDN